MGNGGVADALRYEKKTGNLLSEASHEQKAREVQTRLNNFSEMRIINPLARTPTASGMLIMLAS